MTTTSNTVKIELNLNLQALNDIFDVDGMGAEDIIELIKSHLEFLNTHNKNLTNQQYWMIGELYNAFRKAESA